ncbi:hypothetical protein Tco_0307745 [Tanacetum coccineum]
MLSREYKNCLANSSDLQSHKRELQNIKNTQVGFALPHPYDDDDDEDFFEDEGSVDNSISSDDESFSDEDVPKEIYSNPIFDKEIIFDKVDASIISSPKIESLLEQFSDELAHIDPIPPGIEEADFDLEEEIRLVENLSYDNSSPRPL